MLSGQNPENLSPKDNPGFWGKAILRGGGLGFFGDFLYNEVTEQGHRSPLLSVGCGSDRALEDILSLTHGAFFKSRRGERRSDEAAKLIRFTKGNIPIINMWYTQAVADHLLWKQPAGSGEPRALGSHAGTPGGDLRQDLLLEAGGRRTACWSLISPRRSAARARRISPAIRELPTL